MKTKRAIELLNRISDSQFDGIHGDERREALDMAVRALVEPNIGQKTIDCIIKRLNDEDRTTGDTIYRQDAIDALDKHIDTFDAIDTNYLCGLRTAMSFLKEMPSAQHEVAKDTNVPNNDCISRQAAIDIVRNRVKRFTTACVLAVTEIEQLPSAQPDDRIKKIADLLEGTIDHFDRDDAMDLLYQIKAVLR